MAATRTTGSGGKRATRHMEQQQQWPHGYAAKPTATTTTTRATSNKSVKQQN